VAAGRKVREKVPDLSTRREKQDIKQYSQRLQKEKDKTGKGRVDIDNRCRRSNQGRDERRIRENERFRGKVAGRRRRKRRVALTKGPTAEGPKLSEEKRRYARGLDLRLRGGGGSVSNSSRWESGVEFERQAEDPR